MFRSIFDRPQGDIFSFFNSVTKDKLIGVCGSMPVILVVLCVNVVACSP